MEGCSVQQGGEVIVVGAGIVGSSIAFHLASAGTSVTLIEQTHPAGGPTGKSSALLHAFYLQPELSQLSIRGLELLLDIPKIVDEGPFVQQIGMMWVCGEENAVTWNDSVERIKGEGSRMEALSPDDLAKAAPGLRTDKVGLAIWEPEFGYADSFGATNAIARAARARGASVLQNTLVRGLTSTDGRITGVTFADGTTQHADTVVVAAGPWTNRLLATAGLGLPLRVERHPMAVLDAGGKAREVLPFAWCDDVLCNYARPDGDGVILAGVWSGGGTAIRHEEAGREEVVDDPDHYKEGVEESESVAIVESFGPRVPAMLELGIRPGYAGLYDMSPDDMPVIGKLPGVDGLVVAAGSSGHGFKTGPAVGEAVANLILHGDQEILTPFAPSRFAAAR